MDFLKNSLILEYVQYNECITQPGHVPCGPPCRTKYSDLARYVQHCLAYPTGKNEMRAAEAQKRWKWLLKTYLKELRKLRNKKEKYIKSGSTGEPPVSCWIYFHSMNLFLEKYYPEVSVRYRSIERENPDYNIRGDCLL